MMDAAFLVIVLNLEVEESGNDVDAAQGQTGSIPSHELRWEEEPAGGGEGLGSTLKSRTPDRRRSDSCKKDDPQ